MWVFYFHGPIISADTANIKKVIPPMIVTEKEEKQWSGHKKLFIDQR